jgi:UDP:flavonoid glycosyltransferase YjiC (YdhE family)
MLPRRLLGPRNLRTATLSALDDPTLKRKASEIAAWGKDHDGPDIAAEMLEALAADEPIPAATG